MVSAARKRGCFTFPHVYLWLDLVSCTCQSGIARCNPGAGPYWAEAVSLDLHGAPPRWPTQLIGPPAPQVCLHGPVVPSWRRWASQRTG